MRMRPPSGPSRAGKRETFLVETVMPSGKFATNDLVLSLAVLAFNISRAIGQATLISPDSPVRHPAKRRRIRTVMQDRGTRHTLPRIGQSNW